jgi:hypothetical protein
MRAIPSKPRIAVTQRLRREAEKPRISGGLQADSDSKAWRLPKMRRSGRFDTAGLQCRFLNLRISGVASRKLEFAI